VNAAAIGDDPAAQARARILAAMSAE